MKNLLLLFVSIIGFTIFGFTQSKTLQSGNIMFHAIEKKDVKASSSNFTSELNLDEKSVHFSVPIVSFTFKSELMQKHFFNANNMSADLFPKAEFFGDLKSNSDLTKIGRHIVKVNGEMTIKGIKVPFNTNGLIINKNGETVIKSTFLIDGHKFGLDSDKIKGFSDKIEVELNATY